MNFECHITSTVEHAETCARVAEQLGWKTSEIARDPVLGNGPYFYLTAHSTEYLPLYGRMKETVAHLLNHGAPVLREKIELIMYDTKGKS